MPSLTPIFLAAISSLFSISAPAALVLAISIVVGLLMVVLFRYTSNQKAIRIAKDQL